jgi:hypothetical protein
MNQSLKNTNHAMQIAFCSLAYISWQGFSRKAPQIAV